MQRNADDFGSERMSADQIDDERTNLAFQKRIPQRSDASINGRATWSALKSKILAEESRNHLASDRQHNVAKTQHDRTKVNRQTKDDATDARHGTTMKRQPLQKTWSLLIRRNSRPAEQGKPSPGNRPTDTSAVSSLRVDASKRDPRALNEEQLKRLTKSELDRIARAEDLPYRSKMNKAQLARTLRKHFRQAS
jgi:hypothetical protein